MGGGLRRVSSALVLWVVAAVVAAGCTTDTATPPTTLPPLESGGGDTEATASVVRYGLATSPSSPWAHYRTSCDTTCGTVFGAVTDTLFATTTDNELVGLLVDTAEVNRDGTVHTWTLRSGIEFSDGTPLDAGAVKLNVDACRHSALTGPGLAGIDDVRAEGLEVTITSLAPWPTLPVHFAETPCGHMFSGAWLSSLPDLPMRAEGAPFSDPAIAARPAAGDPSLPVGLGAFTVASFAPGNGNSMLLETNPTYWRGPVGITGESLPRADQIELVVIEDDATRLAALDIGQFDVIHTSSPTTRQALVSDSSVTTSTSNAYADTVQLVANSSGTANANGEPGMLGIVSCRRAIARSIDHQTLVAAVGDVAIANGPFAPDSPGHDPERQTPSFDPVVARQWAQRCTEDMARSSIGSADGEPIEPRTLRLIAGSGDRRAAVLESMTDAAFASAADDGGPVVDVEVVELSAGELGLAALLGDFDLLLWENHGGIHPDLEFEWWFSGAGQDAGAVSTNVGRIDDPALDRALVDLRRSSNPIDVERAVAGINRAFDVNRWATWLYWTEWTVASAPAVDVDLGRRTPEGVELAPMINGVHSLQRVQRLPQR
jgi:peptide/nickel transport system substrate-binding protein